MASRITISVEDDATPLVLGVASDLRARLQDAGFGERTEGLRGSAAVRSASGETATLRLSEEGVSVRHGFDEGAEVRAVADRVIEGEGGHPELAGWLREVLDPPGADWRQAGKSFWSVLEGMPGAPAALLVVETESGEQERYGSAEGRAYELHGKPADLVAVLSGRLPLLDAAFEGRAHLRGTFPEISVLSGAGHRLRHEGTAG